MKSFVLLLAFCSFGALITAQSVGINTTTPDASAILDVESTEQGFLPPRMTTIQRDAIDSPAIGLVVFNTTTDCLNYYIGYQWITLCGTEPRYPLGFVHCNPNNMTKIVDVLNPVTGKIWMDRNLGATRVAIDSLDANAFGDLYQWGRFAEGHQCRTSPVHSSSLANTSAPNAGNPWDGKYITSTTFDGDWLTVSDADLWPGVDSPNGPCPSGYRLPTELEWIEERASWSTDNAAGAFGSPLKLPKSGYRVRIGGVISHSFNLYWAGTVNGNDSYILSFSATNANVYADERAWGCCVRCIKDGVF